MDVFTDQRIAKVVSRFEQLKAEKLLWINTWQLVGYYVQPSMQFIMGHMPQGQIMTTRMFDSTAPKCAHQAASSITGAVWPSGPRTFNIGPPDDMDPDIANSAEVKAWYASCSKKLHSIMDDPKCGLLTSIHEYMLDQLTIGTSGIFAEENFGPDAKERPVRYYPLDCKRVCIAEGPDGFVDTLYIERHYTPKQVVQEYGIENVSQATRELFLSNQLGKHTHIRVLHAIEPRIANVPNLFGNANLPVASIHIELDHNWKLRESGYAEMPGFVTRFWKFMNEVYGRSPATENMPDIIEVNHLRETLIVAREKHLSPPIILNNDGSLGNGVFDTSPNAVNIRDAAGRMNEQTKIVEQIYDTGPVNESEDRVEQLQQTIERAYFIDRLNDLGNDTRMTAFETDKRDKMRGQSLNTTYSRQQAEMFNRLVERTFHIGLNKDLFGYVRGDSEWNYLYLVTGQAPPTIPDPIARLMLNGQHFYKVNFVSPAMRIMQQDQLEGMMGIVTVVKEIGPIDPTISDNVNWDRFFMKMAELNGAPQEVLSTTEEKQQIRQNRAAMNQQVHDAAQAEQQSLTAKHTGQAMQAAANAGVNPLALLSGGQKQAS